MNTKKNGFWLSVDDHPDISGTFDRELFQKIKHAGEHSVKVPSKVKVELIKITINNHLTDEHTVKYTLKSFDYIKSQERK